MKNSPSNETHIDWYSFLARQRLPSPSAECMEQLEGSSILVTGAGGSIGSALSTRLAYLKPRRLVLLDSSEQAVYNLNFNIAKVAFSSRSSIVLGSVLDADLLNEIFHNYSPQIVFHAAALKHVPLLEEHPLAAIATNVLGTSNLLKVAQSYPASRVLLLSTDKAVEPASILGATKNIAEQITRANGGIAVRLANVLGSSGSVVGAFMAQIAAGQPVSITNSDAERYFLTSEEAVDLLLIASSTTVAGSVVIPDLDRAHSTQSLAAFLIHQLSPTNDIPVTFSGLRPGEKIRESLLSADERLTSQLLHGYLQIQHPQPALHTLQRLIQSLRESVQERNLAAALEIVCHLVPTYRPSSTLLKAVANSRHGATAR